jgi:hypothetical protein
LLPPSERGKTSARDRLYFGNNLQVLRDRAAFPDDGVNLI